MQPLMTAGELAAYLDEVFPEMEGKFEIEEIASMRARLRRKVTPADLRPGGTVSGPTMFALADCAFYAVTLAMIGRQALAVTTSCSINFMRKPEPQDLVPRLIGDVQPDHQGFEGLGQVVAVFGRKH